MLPIYARTIYLFFFFFLGGGVLVVCSLHCISGGEIAHMSPNLKGLSHFGKKVVKYTRIVGIPKR